MIQTILIIEDERLNTERLIRILNQTSPHIKIVGCIETIVDAVKWLNSNPMPDLLLMDVRLRDGLSFEILDQVNITSSIIFTTAYDEYAIKAFKYDSIDYLLKPIDEEELQIALEKVARLESKNELDFAQIKNLIQAKEYRHRFLLPYRDGYKTVLVNNIDFFFTENRITYAVIKNEQNKIVLSQPLEELEQQLDPKIFFRASRQFILHIDAISQIHNHFNGKLKIELHKHSDVEIFVSRERSVSFKKWLDY